MTIAARYRRLCNRAGRDGWSRLFGYPVGRLLLVWLERAPLLRPTHLTLASIAARVAGALLLLAVDRALLVAGVALLQVGQVLDSMDGTLARARGQHSATGAFLDKVGDALCLGLLALVVGLRASTDGAIYSVLALAGGFLHLARGYMHWVARALAPTPATDALDGSRPAGEPVRPLREWLAGFPRLALGGEADLYLWISIAALAGAWRAAAIVLLASQAIAVVVLAAHHLRRLAVLLLALLACGDQQSAGSPPSVRDQPARRAVGNLVYDGIPELPAALRRRVEPFLSPVPSELVDITADGRAVLVSKRAGDAEQIYLVAEPGAEPVQLTTGPDPVRSARFLGGRPDRIVYAADRAGDERFQIYRLEVATGAVTRLTDGTSRNLGLVVSRDGARVAWASNARNGRDQDIWLSDGTGAARAALLVEREGTWTPLAFTRDGRRLLVRRYLSIAESELHLVDVARRTVAPAVRGGPIAAYRAAAIAPDGRSIVVAADRDGEFTSIYRIVLATGEVEPALPSLEWNVEELALSPDGRTLAFVANQDGWSRLHLLDLGSGRSREPPGLPDGVIGGLAYAAAAGLLAFTAETATAPAAVYSLDPDDGPPVRWTAEGLGELAGAELVAPTLIRYPTFDGRSIPALYHRPRGAGRFPVLIDIHGGPEGQSRPVFRGLTQYLASHGWAVLLPNVRGSDGYGKSYLALDNGRRREDAVRDVGALLDWIARQPELDSARVAVTGASYGGYLVLASLVHFGDRLAGGIDLAGSSSFLTLLASVPPELRDIRRREVGDERDPAMRDFLHAISPLTHAGRIRDPLLVVQGKNDRRVPPAESEQIVRAVRAGGTPVWYLVALDEGHGLARTSNRDAFAFLSAFFLETQVR